MDNLDRITTIEQLALKYSNSVKGFTLVNYYKGAFPVYRVITDLIVQRKKELGLIQEYCLKFIKAEAKTVANISNFMGLSEKVIESNLLALHQVDMVNFRFATKGVVLTDKGLEVLEKNNFIIPESINYTFLVDGITGRYQINETLDRVDKVKNYSHIIPYNVSMPIIDTINLKEIKLIVENNKSVNQRAYIDGDLLNVNNIDKIEKCYRKQNVLVFSNEKGEIELQVYDKNKRCSEYENILIKMLNNKFKIIPTVQKDENVDGKEQQYYIPIMKEAKENNKEVKELEKKIKSIEESVEESRQLEVETDEEFKSKTMKIEELEIELQKEKERLAMIPKLLNTYDHRPLLLKTLKEAKKQIVIVSPWIKAAATDYELRLEMHNALKRRVKLIICYGISNEVEKDVKYALKQLEDLKADVNFGRYLNIIKLGNTHEKVLISDDKYVVITSFNWLSFKGDPNRGFRQETGTLTESTEFVKEMLKNLQIRINEVGYKESIIL